MKDFPHGTEYLLIMALALFIALLAIGGYQLGALMAWLFL